MSRKFSFDPTNGVFLYWVAVFLYILFPVLLIERMVLGMDILTNRVFPFYRLFSVIACLICLFAIFHANRLHVYVYTVITGTFLLLGFTKGLFPIYDGGYFVTHVSAGLAMFAFFWAGSNCYIPAKKLYSLLKISSYMFFIEYSISILGAYIVYHYSGLLVQDNFHLSLNIAPILISFVYFLVEGKLILNVVVFLLLFLSGKRSLLVTAITMYALYFLIAGRESRLYLLRRLTPVFLATSISIIMLFVCSDSFSFMDSAFRRLLTMNVIDGSGADIDNISSGRWNECLVVYDVITSSISNAFFGSGFGNFIEIIYESTRDHQIYRMEKTGFDVLPVHFMYYFGLPGTILLLSGICVILVKQYRHVRNRFRREISLSSKADMVWFLAVVSILANSFFTYINPDPFLWFALGLMCSRRMKRFNITLDLQNQPYQHELK